MTQLHIYISFLIFFSIMGYARILNTVSCVTQEDLVGYPFYIYSFSSADPKLPFHSSPTSPPGYHEIVLYVCESVSIS